jgi:hypothetical protein
MTAWQGWLTKDKIGKNIRFLEGLRHEIEIGFDWCCRVIFIKIISCFFPLYALSHYATSSPSQFMRQSLERARKVSTNIYISTVHSKL